MAGLFNQKPRQVLSTVEMHQSVSDDAFSMFTGVVSKLTIADEAIEKDINRAQSVIDAEEAKKKSLIDIRKKNNNLSVKINQFLSSI